MEIKITFTGGKKVNAEIDGMVIPTDQPRKYGGEGSAPTPYDHFLASIGTCAGIYVLSFCEERKISTDRISLVERFETEKRGDKVVLTKIILEVIVPPEFPEKYHNALIKVIDQCAVKKTIMNPPKFAIRTILK
ncbi:MAG TPA: OsmC family protein [Thermodesulfovibrionales bacterium]|nr:OsmC family protein [Thermodesulfovibrionales bacterium]